MQLQGRQHTVRAQTLAAGTLRHREHRGRAERQAPREDAARHHLRPDLARRGPGGTEPWVVRRSFVHKMNFTAEQPASAADFTVQKFYQNFAASRRREFGV